jgi:hypothetical protein
MPFSRVGFEKYGTAGEEQKERIDGLLSGSNKHKVNEKWGNRKIETENWTICYMAIV